MDGAPGIQPGAKAPYKRRAIHGPEGPCSLHRIVLEVFLQPLLHDFDSLRTFVDEQKVAAVFGGGFAGGSAAGEEVEDSVAGVGMDLYDAFEDAERLLGGVA